MHLFEKEERHLEKAIKALDDKIDSSFPVGREVVVERSKGVYMRGTVDGPARKGDVRIRKKCSGRYCWVHYSRVWSHIEAD